MSHPSTSQWSLPPQPARKSRSLTGDLDATSTLLGQRIDRYTILEEVGRGAMGIVFRARRDDGHLVAIKVMEPRWGQTEQASARMLREAKCLFELRHDHVIRLLDVVPLNERPALVTDFVSGVTLQQYVMDHGVLSLDRAVDLFTALADGLASVHSAGVLHRDIKPSNVLLELPDSGESISRAVLCDFGLSRPNAAQSDASGITLTPPGGVIGTPPYMAPEQLLSFAAPDARSDVYALAASLYFALTGRSPANLTQIDQLQRVYADPRYRPIKDRDFPYPERLRLLLSTALDPNPAKRFQSASWLRDELTRFQRGTPSKLVRIKPFPEHDSLTRTVELTCHLDAPADQVWELVANTDHVNRAIGLPLAQFHPDRDAPSRFSASADSAFGTLHWIETPFQWVTGKFHQVYREFEDGPLQWVGNRVELADSDSSCTVTHRITYRARNAWWIPLIEMNLRLGIVPKLRKTYHSIDKLPELPETPTALQRTTPRVNVAMRDRKRSQATKTLRRSKQQWIQRCNDPVVVEALLPIVAAMDSYQASHLRPLELATAVGLPQSRVLSALLAGCFDGLFELAWAVICPSCQVPIDSTDQLSEIASHLHCDFCGISRQIDFSKSIEILFRFRPIAEPPSHQAYCLGGPFRLPHVAAQVVIPVGKTCQVELELPCNRYQVDSPQGHSSHRFRVSHSASRGTHAIRFRTEQADAQDEEAVLNSGGQTLLIQNDTDHELLIRVAPQKNSVPRLTLHQALGQPDFARWFPEQIETLEDLELVAQRVVVSVRIDQSTTASNSVRQARDVAQMAATCDGLFVSLDDEGVCQFTFDHSDAATEFLETLLSKHPGAKYAMAAGEVRTMLLMNRPVHCGEGLRHSRNVLRQIDGAVIPKTTVDDLTPPDIRAR